MDELKLRIIACLDVTDIMDILGWEVADLVDELEDYIAENKEEFQRACQ